MCGPIALALPLKSHSWSARFLSSLVYHTGRMLTYGFLGLLFGLLGLGLYIWGIQQWVTLALGTIMILSVGFPLLFHGRGVRFLWYDKLMSAVKKLFARFFCVQGWLSLFIIGLLNGLLPCGLVYIALAGALLTTTPLNGALYMMAFGLGTIPALMGLSILGNAFGQVFRRRIQGVTPFLVLIIGVLFVLRGMNLGIPYLSPKMDPPVKHQTEEFQKPECCRE
jgi:sulfite exporter TauE/SafE